MIEALSLLSRSESTERSYLEGLLRFSMHLGEDVDLDRLVDEIKSGEKDQNRLYKDFLYAQASSGLAPSTVRVRTAGVLKFMEANDCPVTEKPKQKVYTVHEDVLPSRDTLLRAVNAGDLRATTAILLLASSGMRVSELTNLELRDIDTDESPAPVRVAGARREGGKVKGAKERKSRLTFISDEARESLELYLDKRRQQGEEIGPRSPVMATESGGAMSKRNLGVILRNVFNVAGAEKEGEGPGARYDLRPHVLRKWFKTQLISSGVPGPIADRLCGHSRYMAREYELYTQEKLAEWYSKAMPNLSLVNKPKIDEDDMKLDTLFLLAKGLGLGESEISRIKKKLAKTGEMTPEAAAELIGKELVAPLKLRASMNPRAQPQEEEEDDHGKHGKQGNPGKPRNPGEKTCQAKIITEKDLEKYMEAGWEIAAPLGNRKIAVRRRS